MGDGVMITGIICLTIIILVWMGTRPDNKKKK